MSTDYRADLVRPGLKPIRSTCFRVSHHGAAALALSSLEALVCRSINDSDATFKGYISDLAWFNDKYQDKDVAVTAEDKTSLSQTIDKIETLIEEQAPVDDTDLMAVARQLLDLTEPLLMRSRMTSLRVDTWTKAAQRILSQCYRDASYWKSVANDQRARIAHLEGSLETISARMGEAQAALRAVFDTAVESGD